MTKKLYLTITHKRFYLSTLTFTNQIKPNQIKHRFRMSTIADSNVKPNPNLITNQQQRLQEVKKFDESKIGVKGLVDRGLTTIPSFFIHQNRFPVRSVPDITNPGLKTKIPVIDFSSPRTIIVDQVRRASSDLGFFQIINHGIPLHTITNILNATKAFNEQPEAIKMQYYGRDLTKPGAAYATNFHLYKSKAASWHETLRVTLSPTPPDWDLVPETCVEPLQEWDKAVKRIVEELLEMLCEGLGIESDRLKELSCLDSRVFAGQYYPYCPQPELTVGLASHSDPGVLTMLVQNEMYGLQVKVEEEWVDVEPVEGAIVINIGDILQIMSNDVYKSVEHRVLANPFPEPRVSAVVFFNPGRRDDLYGPLPEFVSAENPPLYGQFTLTDYVNRFLSKELDGKSLANYYRL